MRDLINQQLDSLFMDMASGSKPSEKNGQLGDFRVSSFPFCPLRGFLFRKKTDSFSMDFYTSMGTGIHDTAQKWITLGGFRRKVFACWKCPSCKTVVGPSFYPEDACRCKTRQPWLYEEITIKYNGLSGHVDLVVEIRPGKFAVVDFKSTDLSGKKRKYPDRWETFYPASRSSIMQISTYSTLLRVLFKLNIVAWSLVYVDRGKKIETPNDYYKVTRPWGREKHDNMKEWIDLACRNNDKLRKLDAIMQKASGYSPQAEHLLKSLVKTRPCVDQESYEAFMDYKFYKGFTKTPDEGVRNGCCVLKKACCSGNRHALAAVQKLL